MSVTNSPNALPYAQPAYVQAEPNGGENSTGQLGGAQPNVADGSDGGSDTYSPAGSQRSPFASGDPLTDVLSQLAHDVKDPTVTKAQLAKDVTTLIALIFSSADNQSGSSVMPGGSGLSDAAAGNQGDAVDTQQDVDSGSDDAGDTGADEDVSQAPGGAPQGAPTPPTQPATLGSSAGPPSNGMAVGGSSQSGQVAGSRPNTPSSQSFTMGVLPDYDNGSTGGAAGFENRTGVKPSTISGYADMKDGSFDLGAAKRWIDDASHNGIGEVSMSISAYETGSLNSSQLQGIKDMMAYAKQSGVKLDIRYGYEMNYGGGGGAQGGRVNNNNNPEAFKTQWNQVANIAHAAEPPASMIWSPNIASGGTRPYTDWLPSPASSVDVYAVDYYPPAGSSAQDIAKAVKPVADMAAAAGKPFILGEVAVKDGGSAADKQDLLKQLTSPAMQAALPNYQGFYWFDYNKGGANMSLSQDAKVSGNLQQQWAASDDSI